jgi:hypothetical protein
LLSLSLFPNIFALFSPARACTCSHPAEIRHQRSLFPLFLKKNEAWNAVLHLSELSDQLDVTLESSKMVKLALTWVTTNQSDAIE